jgi:hypothetical protein
MLYFLIQCIVGDPALLLGEGWVVDHGALEVCSVAAALGLRVAHIPGGLAALPSTPAYVAECAIHLSGVAPAMLFELELLRHYSLLLSRAFTCAAHYNLY